MTANGERKLLALLEEIRNLLAYAGTPDALAGVEADSSVCPHPEDRRIDLTAMGEVHWKCRDCQYEYRQPVGAPPATSGL